MKSYSIENQKDLLPSPRSVITTSFTRQPIAGHIYGELLACLSWLLVSGDDASAMPPVGESGQKEGGRERWMVVFALGQITPDTACRGAAGARSTPLPPPPPPNLHCTSDAGGEGGSVTLPHSEETIPGRLSRRSPEYCAPHDPRASHTWGSKPT